MLLQWKNCRNEWKFEKLRQIWLIDHLMYKHSISDKMFPIVLEYFRDCRGKARKVLVEKAMEIIKKSEEETNEQDKEAIIDSVTYKRARQILQVIDEMTEDEEKKIEKKNCTDEKSFEKNSI